jgi:hypothetical protein
MCQKTLFNSQGMIKELLLERRWKGEGKKKKSKLCGERKVGTIGRGGMT